MEKGRTLNVTVQDIDAMVKECINKISKNPLKEENEKVFYQNEINILLQAVKSDGVITIPVNSEKTAISKRKKLVACINLISHYSWMEPVEYNSYEELKEKNPFYCDVYYKLGKEFFSSDIDTLKQAGIIDEKYVGSLFDSIHYGWASTTFRGLKRAEALKIDIDNDEEVDTPCQAVYIYDRAQNYRGEVLDPKYTIVFSPAKATQTKKLKTSESLEQTIETIKKKIGTVNLPGFVFNKIGINKDYSNLTKSMYEAKLKKAKELLQLIDNEMPPITDKQLQYLTNITDCQQEKLATLNKFQASELIEATTSNEWYDEPVISHYKQILGQ